MGKLYIMTDYEGVAGIDDWDNRKDLDPVNALGRMRHRKLLTAEVNAAVDGALDAGFGDVLVNDAHGGGRTILFEEVHPQCRLLRGARRPTWLAGLDASFDACIFVGAHAMADTPNACLCHTFSHGVKEWQFCGVRIGEIGATAAGAGTWDVPFVLVSGGRCACREAAELVPGIVTAEVKEDISELAAIHLPAPAACELIRAKVAEALRRPREMKPLTFKPPYVFRAEVREDAWSPEAQRPGMRVLDARTVEHYGEDARAVLKAAIY